MTTNTVLHLIRSGYTQRRAIRHALKVRYGILVSASRLCEIVRDLRRRGLVAYDHHAGRYFPGPVT